MKTITTKDGLIWAVLNKEEALQAWYNEGTVMFIDNEGNCYDVVQTADEIKHLNTLSFGLELGCKNILLSDWQEACARNNEKRSFEAWLEDKAENLLF